MIIFIIIIFYFFIFYDAGTSKNITPKKEILDF